jgi:hypothetical protein
MAIESANVVGYQQQKLVGGTSFNWLISTFQQVGKELEAQTVGSFAIPTDAGFMSSDSVFMEVYGTDGSLQAQYAFVDEANIANFGLTVPGWYDYATISNWDPVTDEDCKNNEILPFGTGVIITSGEDDSVVTFSGQVYEGEQSYTLVGGTSFNWTGNSTPIDLYLKDFAIPTDSCFMSSDSLFMEVYGTDGSLKAQYAFVDEANMANFGLTVPGWYDYATISNWDPVTDEDCKNETVKINAGQMVIITNGEADTTLTLPNVL